MSSSELLIFQMINRLCGALETGNPATIKTTASAVKRETSAIITREKAVQHRASKNAETVISK